MIVVDCIFILYLTIMKICVFLKNSNKWLFRWQLLCAQNTKQRKFFFLYQLCVVNYMIIQKYEGLG